MMNEPTNSAMRANTSRKVLKIEMIFWNAVLALGRELGAGDGLGPGREGGGHPLLQRRLGDAVPSGDGDPVELPRLAHQRLGGGGVEQGGLGPAPRVDLPEPGDADDVEPLHAVADGHADGVAHGVAPVGRRLGVEHDVGRTGRRRAVHDRPAVERGRRQPVEAEVRRTLGGDERLAEPGRAPGSGPRPGPRRRSPRRHPRSSGGVMRRRACAGRRTVCRPGCSSAPRRRWRRRRRRTPCRSWR